MRIHFARTFAGLLVALAFAVASCGGDGGDGNGREAKGDATAQASPPASLREVSPEDIVPLYEKTAVFILAEGFYGGASSGTGIVLDNQGNILTNNHVVEGAGSLSIRSPEDGREIPARIVGRSPCDDLAIIQARDPTPFVPATLGSVDDIKAGSQVYAVGFPGTPSEGFGQTELSITGGLVSKLNAQFAYYGLQNIIQTDTALNPGNSGGPLVDKTGRVVGINTLGFSAAGLENVNYAIAIDDAKLVYEQLLEGRDIDWIGVNVIPNTPDLEFEFGIPYIPDSVVIIGVDTSSELFEQGWIAGDILSYAEQQPLTMPGDLCDVIRTRRTGDQILLEGLGQFQDGTGMITYDLYSTMVTAP